MEQLIDPQILAVGAMLVMPAKTITDYVKMNSDLPKWSPPIVAFAAAFVIYLLIKITLGAPLTPQLVAHLALASGAASAGAVFTNEWHKATRVGKKAS